VCKQVFIFRPLDNRLTAHYTYQTWRCQGRIQDFKLGGGALKKIIFHSVWYLSFYWYSLIASW
jgi:hypothetical protein